MRIPIHEFHAARPGTEASWSNQTSSLSKKRFVDQDAIADRGPNLQSCHVRPVAVSLIWTKMLEASLLGLLLLQSLKNAALQRLTAMGHLRKRSS
jgi:hypothetical protein